LKPATDHHLCGHTSWRLLRASFSSAAFIAIAAGVASPVSAQMFSPRPDPVCVAMLGDSSHEEMKAGKPTPQDLTSVPLEDLLHEEVTPINVLGSHTHLKNGFMAGYRYMYMEMNHNQSGTHDVSEQEVLAKYPVVHTSMSMQMHMAELMYAPSDNLTLMVMVPYLDNTMHHLTDTGERPTARSAGIGDVEFMGLYNILGDPRAMQGHRLVLNGGFTGPSGSIDETSKGKQLEYSMQLGSGTWDILPGFTYLGESEHFAWGGQALFTVRSGFNDRDYRLGNKYRLSAWLDYKVVDWFGPSLRLDWHAWDKIHGADPALDPARNPAFDANKQAGERLDFLAGLNFYVPRGLFKGTRLSIEGGVPIYQNIVGPNMAVDWMITAACSYTFR